MNRLAGRAGRNFLGTHDPGLEPASGNFAAQPLGRRGRGVETNKLAPRGLERRPDAVKAVDERNLGLPPFARTVAGPVCLGGRFASTPCPFFSPAAAGGGLRGPKEDGLGRRSRLRVIG